MPTITLRGFLGLFFVGCLAGVIGMIALPHDKFLRYQALSDGTAPTAYWIYERIHNDPAPIDIAFIGTSRTGMSVHTRRLEEDLEREGIAAKAANLYIVKGGTNMQYVVVKELLTARKVKLLVIEIIEWEDRKPHPDFIYLADTSDILAAPLVVNVDYFADIARLPGRQVDLYLQTELQKRGWQLPGFVPPPYEGSNLDHAEFITTLDGIKHDRRVTYSAAHMEELRAEQDAAITPPLLPQSLNNIEFRLPRYYMSRILDLASAHDTHVVFLYTPRYGGPSQPQPYLQYASRAELINPWTQLQEYSLWSEVTTHVNWDGAKRMTDYVAAALASRKELQ